MIFRPLVRIRFRTMRRRIVEARWINPRENGAEQAFIGRVEVERRKEIAIFSMDVIFNAANEFTGSRSK